MRIVLDFDGVISIWNGYLKALFAKLFLEMEVNPLLLKRASIVEGKTPLSLEQYYLIQCLTYRDEGVIPLMRLLDGVTEFLPKLAREGHEIFVVTSREGLSLEIARKFSRVQGISFLLKDFIGVGRRTQKNSIIRSIGADLFIDDDWEKLTPLADDKAIGLVLFSQPHNLNCSGRGIERVSSWRDLYRLIKRACN